MPEDEPHAFALANAFAHGPCRRGKVLPTNGPEVGIDFLGVAWYPAAAAAGAVLVLPLAAVR